MANHATWEGLKDRPMRLILLTFVKILWRLTPELHTPMPAESALQPIGNLDSLPLEPLLRAGVETNATWIPACCPLGKARCHLGNTPAEIWVPWLSPVCVFSSWKQALKEHNPGQVCCDGTSESIKYLLGAELLGMRWGQERVFEWKLYKLGDWDGIRKSQDMLGTVPNQHPSRWFWALDPEWWLPDARALGDQGPSLLTPAACEAHAGHLTYANPEAFLRMWAPRFTFTRSIQVYQWLRGFHFLMRSHSKCLTHTQFIHPSPGGQEAPLFVPSPSASNPWSCCHRNSFRPHQCLLGWLGRYWRESSTIC